MRQPERRRLVLAATVTALAVPALWLFDDGDEPGEAAPTTATAVEGGLPSDAGDPGVPVFLEDTTPLVAPAVIDIAIPAAPGSREARGAATFKRFDSTGAQSRCSTPLAPPGVLITVTNVDNGLSTTCTNTASVSVPPGADITLDTAVYVTIAELAEAPVPVRITW
jgi:hypothetical protein